MCKVCKVNRSAYYHWVKAGCIVNKVDERLGQLIEDIFIECREVYGTRRIKEVLLQLYEKVVCKGVVGIKLCIFADTTRGGLRSGL